MRKPKGRGPTLAKDINRKRVYGMIKQQHRTSRVEVAKQLELNKNTVNSIVGELTETGFVRDIGQQDTDKAGRKPIVIEFHAANKWAIGAQLTSTVIHWAVTDLYANPIETFSIPLERSDPETVVGLLSDAVSRLTHKYDSGSCIGMCLGIPGLMETGQVISSSHLGWNGVPIQAMLRANVALPLILDNSVKLASLGEMWHGLGKGIDNFVYCNFGNGVGCSLVVERSIARGVANMAGELGHLVIDRQGPPCGCGNHGCLEAYVGLPRFAAAVRQAIGDTASLPTIERMLDELSRQNVAVVREFGRAAQQIGHALSYVVNLLNPDLIICDGPLMQASDWLFPGILEELQQKCLPATFKRVKLERSRLYPWTSCIGAAANAVQQWEDNAESFA